MLSFRLGATALALALAAGLIDWTPDPAIANIVANWPAVIDAARARGLGLLPDPDFDSIIAAYLSENPRTVSKASAQ